jgi:hypothetical protein
MEQALRKTTEQHPPSDSPKLEIIAEALLRQTRNPRIRPADSDIELSSEV